MKNLNLITIFLLVLLSFSGCKESFLEIQPTDSLNPETYFKNQDHALSAVSAVYSGFMDRSKPFGYSFDPINKCLIYNANYYTNDVLNIGADEFYNVHDVPASYAPLYEMWSNMYDGINRSNNAIAKIMEMDNSKIDPALRDRLVGECKFLRGLFYLTLVQNWGDVPLMIGADATSKDPKPKRADKKLVLEQIATDMKEASAVLPWKYEAKNNDLGRATKGAALSYLGWVQMYLEKWSEAKTSLDAVIQSNTYQLETNFGRIHEEGNHNGPESIFELQFKEEADMNWSNYGNANANWFLTMFTPGEESGWNAYQASKQLYDSYEPGDVRKTYTCMGLGDAHPYPVLMDNLVNGTSLVLTDIDKLDHSDKVWRESKNKKHFGPTITKDKPYSGVYILKYWKRQIKDKPMSSQPAVLFRYAHVLLNYAEVLMKLNDSSGALTSMNKVRERAKLKNLTGLTGDGLMKAINDERRHEFTAEFTLWYDLTRTGKAIEFLKEKYGVTITERSLVYPLPQGELDANNNLVQNQGY